MSLEQVFPIHRLKRASESESSFGLHNFRPESEVGQADYPHRHNFNQVVFLTAGAGTHVVDFHILPITLPTMFFVSAGQVHFWQLEAPLRGYSLHFMPELLASSLTHGAGLDILALCHSLSYTPLHLNREQSTFVQQIMEMAAHEFESYDDDSVLSAYLHILFSHIQRLCKSKEPAITLGSAAELVRKYRRLVSLHFATHRAMEFYADQLGVSAAYLAKCIKEITGYTASQLLRQELILEAKRLLINTDWSVEQVSDELGFEDPAYFGRFFKREAGSSPGTYRKTIFDRHQIKHR